MTELIQYLGLLVAIASLGLQLAAYFRPRRPPHNHNETGSADIAPLENPPEDSDVAAAGRP